MLYKNTSTIATFLRVNKTTVFLEPGQEIESAIPISHPGVDPVIGSPKEEKPVATKKVASAPKNEKSESKEVTNGKRSKAD